MDPMGKYDPVPTLAAGLIRTARDRAELTQSELAELAGMSQQAISAYETGRKEPTLPTIQRIVAAAGFEMRIHLAAPDGHNASLDSFLESLPPRRRIEIERGRRERGRRGLRAGPA